MYYQRLIYEFPFIILASSYNYSPWLISNRDKKIPLPNFIRKTPMLLNGLLEVSLYRAVRHRKFYLHPHRKATLPVNSGHSYLCVIPRPADFTILPFCNLSEKPHRYVCLLFQGCNSYPTSKQLVTLFIRFFPQLITPFNYVI